MKYTKTIFAIHVSGSVDRRGYSDQKHHYGVPISDIAKVAKSHKKEWVYDVGLFKRPREREIQVVNARNNYEHATHGSDCCL